MVGWLLTFAVQPFVSGLATRLSSVIVDHVKRRSGPEQRSSLESARTRPASGDSASRPAYRPGIPHVRLVPGLTHTVGLSGRTSKLVEEALRCAPGLNRYAVIAEGSDPQGHDQPTIFVRLEAHPGYVDAFAYLRDMFPTVDSASGFEIRFARFGWDSPSHPADGPFSMWEYVNLTEVNSPDDEIVAGVIAWFMLDCVTIYWRLAGDSHVDLVNDFAASLTSGRVAGNHEADRLADETQGLRNRGFLVETTQEIDSTSLVIARKGRLTVSFKLSADYPWRPPLVAYQRGGELVYLDIDAAGWSESSRLVQIAEGLGS